MQEQSIRIPSNHRLAERVLIALVQSGEWEIDIEGCIWRTTLRHGLKNGGSALVRVTRRRVEKRLPSGYLMVRAMVDGRRVVGSAHRLVWQYIHGDIPPGMVINHRNGRKGHNRPANLEVTTYSGNGVHARDYLNPIVLRGSRNERAKLTESDVIDIRTARSRGEGLVPIARRYGVAMQTVSKICRRGSWRHVADFPERRRELAHA